MRVQLIQLAFALHDLAHRARARVVLRHYGAVTRDQTIDIAKAIAIVAIVFGHVWRGLFSAGLIADQRLFELVDTTVYMWHLTVFAFCAGLFVERGMRRAGAWRYARDRDLDFLWLYLLWSLVQGSVKLLTASLVNSPTSVSKVLELWIPDAQMWFFGWIALMLVLAAAVQPWRSRLRMIASLLAAAAVSAALWGLGGTLLFTQGLGLSVYFWVALVLRGDRLTSLTTKVSWASAAVVWAIAALSATVISLTGVATPPTVAGEDRSTVSVALGFIASTLGLVAVLAISRVLARTVVSGALAFVGRQTMAVFLVHIMFASGTRIALERVGIDDVVLQVVLGTLAGVCGSIAVGLAAAKLRAGWLFAAPGWLVRPRAVATGAATERNEGR